MTAAVAWAVNSPSLASDASGQLYEQRDIGAPFVRASCTEGQGASPYEQNTQQSPGLGFVSAEQARHS